MARLLPQEWPDIFDWTTGLVFFSTPFRGAQGMNQLELIEAARRQYSSDQIEGETLRILQSGNEILLNLVDEFCQVRQDAKVTCFYERKPTAIGKLFGRDDMKVDSLNSSIYMTTPMTDARIRTTLSIKALAASIHRLPLRLALFLATILA